MTRSAKHTFTFMVFFSIVFCLFIAKSHAATIAASSCSYADVSAAVTAASPGDTVNVPAGSCTWNSTLAITKGINLMGAGIGSTVITRGSWHLITYAPSNYDLDTPFRISGFSFDMGTYSGSGDLAAIVLGEDWKDAPYTPQTKIRIDHNRVYSSGTLNYNAYFMIYQGALYGVVDNNILEDVNYLMRNLKTAWGSSWWDNTASTGIGYNFGDKYVLIFEDNTINFAGNAIDNTFTNSQFSGRFLLRYNTVTLDNNGWPLIDLHGYQYSDMHSSFGAEIYGNLIVGGDWGGYLFQTRGGKSLAFYNNWTGTGSPGITTSTSAVICPASQYIEPEMIHDTYFWRNRRNSATGSLIGSYCDDSGISCGGRTRPQEGTDFFDDTTSSGVRCGTLANIPTTCTTGQAYWATNQSCSDLTGMIGVNPTNPISGTLYKCVSSNTWNSFYTPYTYPHPLRGTPPPDTTPPIVTVTSPPATLNCTENPMTVQIQAGTDEAATMRFATSAEYEGGKDTYAEMTSTFSFTGGTTHTQSHSRACGASYSVWIAAQNLAGLASTPTEVAYTIGAAAPEPVVFISGTKFGENSSCAVNNITTDNYLSSTSPTTAYATTTSFNLRTSPTDTAARTILVKMDLTSIPTNAVVSEAKLYLYQFAADGDSTIDTTIHKVTGDAWTNLATWNTYDGTNSWGATLGALGDIAAAEETVALNITSGWKSWTVTTMVSDWVATPANNKGLAVTTDQGTSHAAVDTYREFYTSNYSDAAFRPILIVNYSIPAPADKTISGSGTLTLTPGGGGTLTFSW